MWFLNSFFYLPVLQLYQILAPYSSSIRIRQQLQKWAFPEPMQLFQEEDPLLEIQPDHNLLLSNWPPFIFGRSTWPVFFSSEVTLTSILLIFFIWDQTDCQLSFGINLTKDHRHCKKESLPEYLKRLFLIIVDCENCAESEVFVTSYYIVTLLYSELCVTDWVFIPSCWNMALLATAIPHNGEAGSEPISNVSSQCDSSISICTSLLSPNYCIVLLPSS